MSKTNQASRLLALANKSEKCNVEASSSHVITVISEMMQASRGNLLCQTSRDSRSA